MRGRILIVDDQHDSRDALAEMLVLRGYEVAGMADAPTTEVMAKAADLVLAVFNPSDPERLRLLVRLKRNRPDLPILMMSATASGQGLSCLRRRQLVNSLECDRFVSAIDRLLRSRTALALNDPNG